MGIVKRITTIVFAFLLTAAVLCSLSTISVSAKSKTVITGYVNLYEAWQNIGI